MARRKMAKVPHEYQNQQIAWLVLEEDPKSSGVFIFYHKSLDKPCEFDDWYENIEAAERVALEDWGVKKTDWRTE